MVWPESNNFLKIQFGLVDIWEIFYLEAHLAPKTTRYTLQSADWTFQDKWIIFIHNVTDQANIVHGFKTDHSMITPYILAPKETASGNLTLPFFPKLLNTLTKLKQQYKTPWMNIRMMSR